MAKNRMEVHEKYAEPWRVTLVDTGEHTKTGGRLGRVARYLKDEPVFCFTYGDGIADIDIGKSIAFHRAQRAAATVTAVVPPGRFGALELELNGERVRSFVEKPQGDGGVINGGFFVLNREVLDLIEHDATIWESESLAELARCGQLAAWQHRGFWHPVDTLRDRQYLEALWAEGKAPWKVWV
jgi:glucose-1-phosphate cytidylyltransferase